MENSRAQSNYVRISPRKARLAAGLIRGLPVENALLQLANSHTKAGPLLKKTLDSAIANAESQTDARREDLRVLEVRIDGGPTFKRAVSRSKGMRNPIIKRTSHFTVVVGV